MPASCCSQDLSEWACIYIKYLQIMRKLETAYDQMVHPQKRQVLQLQTLIHVCMRYLMACGLKLHALNAV